MRVASIKSPSRVVHTENDVSLPTIILSTRRGVAFCCYQSGRPHAFEVLRRRAIGQGKKKWTNRSFGPKTCQLLRSPPPPPESGRERKNFASYFFLFHLHSSPTPERNIFHSVVGSPSPARAVKPRAVPVSLPGADGSSAVGRNGLSSRRKTFKVRYNISTRTTKKNPFSSAHRLPHHPVFTLTYQLQVQLHGAKLFFP